MSVSASANVCSGELYNISVPDKVRIIKSAGLAPIVNVRMSSPQFKPFPDSWDWDSIVGMIMGVYSNTKSLIFLVNLY